jgi:hypothetical protein
MNQSHSKTNRQPLPPRIVVDDPHNHLDGVLGRIVRWFQLDSYGSTLLDKSVAISMKAIAVLLIANFVFDLGAWWLLCNSIFSGGQGVFELGMHSIIALIVSLIVSIVIFIYERAFMTADISTQKSRFALPVLMRIAVILVAAAITTQPVELMFFKGPIEQRVHDESIRLEAITKLKDWQVAEKKTHLEGVSNYYTENQKKAEETNLREGKKLKDLKSELRSAEYSLTRAQNWLSGVRSRLSRAEKADDEEAKAYLSRQVTLAQDAVSSAIVKVDSVKQQISDQEIIVSSSEKDKEKAGDEVKQQVEKAVKESARVRDWIAVVRKSNRGQTVTESGGDWRFHDQIYDFFQQLRVLSDLRNARPARWPEAGKEDREALANTFNFKTPADEAAEARIDATFYAYSYWAVIGIAFVIPILLLAFKLLQPQELRDYYSKRQQDRARGIEGNP